MNFKQLNGDEQGWVMKTASHISSILFAFVLFCVFGFDDASLFMKQM